MNSALKILNELLAGLDQRQREVLAGRFGLDKAGKPQTLAALGSRYKVTRERIRQIEVSALERLRERIKGNRAASDVLERGEKLLRDAGGVLKQDSLLESLQAAVPGLGMNQLAVLLEASGAFELRAEDRHYRAFYHLDKQSLKNAENFISQWADFLRGKKEHVLSGKYHEHLEDFLRKKGMKPQQAANFLSVSKRVHKNPYGDIGLAEWTEIRPKTIRDKVYVILKKKKEPLHFRLIADLVNQVFLPRNPASAPTVHNELIKDNRFVLVGRGIYALREQGYEPGTAKDVIQRVLRRHGPLKPREVVLAVQRERFFKPNTVLVNLQNKSHFLRLSNGTYQVRES